MCLISFAPQGTDKYSEKFIEGVKKGATNNVDGFGYAYWLPGENKIHFNKTFAGITTLLEKLRELNLPLESKLVIHSRNGNRGMKDIFNAHPFIVSDDPKDLYDTWGETEKPVLVHNGTFYGYNDTGNVYSDTYLFVKKFMAIPEVLSLLRRDVTVFKDLFDSKISTNKIIIIFPDGETKVIGNFITDDQYLFSNDCYKNVHVKDVGGSTSYTNGYGYPYQNHNKYLPANSSDLDSDKDDDLPILFKGKNKTENNPLGIRFNNYTRDEIYFECLEDGPKYKRGDLFVFYRGHHVPPGERLFYLRKVERADICKSDYIQNNAALSQYIFADELEKYFMVKSRPKYLFKYNSYAAFTDWIGNLSGNKIKKILRAYNDSKESDITISIKIENKVSHYRKDAIQLFIFENFDNFKKTSSYIIQVEKEKELADIDLRKTEDIVETVDYGDWAQHGV